MMLTITVSAVSFTALNKQIFVFLPEKMAVGIYINDVKSILILLCYKLPWGHPKVMFMVIVSFAALNRQVFLFLFDKMILGTILNQRQKGHP